MCEFCTEHGEGKKSYLEMKNYSNELLHAELTAREKQAIRSESRAEWMERFVSHFEAPAVTGIPRTLQEVGMAIATAADLRGPAATEAEILADQKIAHFGQVIPIEDVEQIVDRADSITRMPCGCRFLSTGCSRARYCFGLGITATNAFKGIPDPSATLEVLEKAEVKRVMRQFDEEGLIHSVWTGVTPYLVGLCNCDHDCMAYKRSIENRGVPNFFRAEYICRVNADRCTGCKECVKQCQFGAQYYSSLQGKVTIDPRRCYGCGVCRAVCPADAIELLPREQDPAAAGVWLR